MITAADIHWLAGFLEGEGCFRHSFSRRVVKKPGFNRDGSRKGTMLTITVQVASTDRDVLERAAGLMGGKVHQRKLIRGRKPDFTCQVVGVQAAGVMMTLLPLMGERRAARIREALTAWKSVPACPKRSRWGRMEAA